MLRVESQKFARKYSERSIAPKIGIKVIETVKTVFQTNNVVYHYFLCFRKEVLSVKQKMSELMIIFYFINVNVLKTQNTDR